MKNDKKIQTGINSISSEWFRANIDRKTLKNLSKRTDFEGWKHLIIFALSLSALGFLSVYFWQTWWFIPFYSYYIVCFGVGRQMQFGMSVATEQLSKHES